MARPRSSNPKKKLTITLDPEVIALLGPLQAELEAQAYGALAQSELRVLHGPVRYNRSLVVQMALLGLAEKLGIEMEWEKSAKS